MSQKPNAYPDYVSHSPAPSGLKGIYTYLEKEKTSVKAWTYEPELLPNSDEHQLLIMVEPHFIPEKEEMEAYKSFIEAGNTILLFKENPKGMFGLKSVFIEQDPMVDEESSTIYDKAEREFKANIISNIRLSPNGEDEILLYDNNGPIAIKQTIGMGELIVSNTPQWMTNGALLNDDHIPLVLALIKASVTTDTILFDEYSHGGQNASTIFTLYPKWFLLLMLQGGLFSFLWLWSKGKRFGPILVPREETVRFSDEGIKALAAWYQRGRRYHDSLVIQADYIKVQLHDRWGIPYNYAWKDLVSPLERKWSGMSNKEIRPFLNDLTNILTKEKVSKQEYLLWSKKLDRLRKEVEEG